MISVFQWVIIIRNEKFHQIFEVVDIFTSISWKIAITIS